MGHEERPAAEVAAAVRRIWDEVLRPGPHELAATFFDLSGHSIAAVRIVARLEDELGLPVTLEDLFDDPTLDELVHVLALRAASGRWAA